MCGRLHVGKNFLHVAVWSEQTVCPPRMRRLTLDVASRVFPDRPGRASYMEGEPWGIIAKLSSESIRRLPQTATAISVDSMKERKKRRSEPLAYGSIRSAWRPRAVATGAKRYTKEGTCSSLP